MQRSKESDVTPHLKGCQPNIQRTNNRRASAHAHPEAALDSLPLERSLLRIGKRVLRLHHGRRRTRNRLRIRLHGRRLLAHRLQLLRLPAQPANLHSASLRNKIAHPEILSRPTLQIHTQLYCQPQYHHNLNKPSQICLAELPAPTHYNRSRRNKPNPLLQEMHDSSSNKSAPKRYDFHKSQPNHLLSIRWVKKYPGGGPLGIQEYGQTIPITAF